MEISSAEYKIGDHVSYSENGEFYHPEDYGIVVRRSGNPELLFVRFDKEEATLAANVSTLRKVDPDVDVCRTIRHETRSDSKSTRKLLEADRAKFVVEVEEVKSDLRRIEEHIENLGQRSVELRRKEAPKMISLFDFSGDAARPWAKAGYACYCYDIQHEKINVVERFEGGGFIKSVKLDLYIESNIGKVIADHCDRTEFVAGFPPCTDLATSGAAWFEKKREENPNFQTEAVERALIVKVIADALTVPYFIENPVSVLSTLWRKPDFTFHPWQYGGYLPEDDEHPKFPDFIAPRDAYQKRTCIWSGGGFRMPSESPVEFKKPTDGRSSTQDRKLGGARLKTKNIRSSGPRGFLKAVFEANRIEGWIA